MGRGVGKGEGKAAVGRGTVVLEFKAPEFKVLEVKPPRCWGIGWGFALSAVTLGREGSGAATGAIASDWR